MKLKGKLKKSLVILVSMSLLLLGFGGLFPQPVSAALGDVIEAESYSSQSGIQTESCSEGTLNVRRIE